jgi:DNA-binding LacI/PurR family transcriptional regulator
VDGPTGEESAPFARLPVPVVLVERRVPLGLAGAQLDRICSDHEAGAATAVEHLAGLGHRHIALLGRYSHTMPQLIRGYRSATNALGLTEHLFAAPAPIPLDHPDAFEPYAEQLIEAVADGLVSAVLVHTDTDAINLIPHLEERGLNVPADLAIVSYDDELTDFSDVALTAVAPAKQAVGRGAVNLLLRRLAEPNAGATRTELVPELVVRDSCGASTQQALAPVVTEN